MSYKITAAVLDTSALICIAKSESAAQFFLAELSKVAKLYISAATYAELILATMSLQAPGAVDAMAKLLLALKVQTVDFGAQDIAGYRDAAMSYHLKAKPPGLLNMGDVFAFQLATTMDVPLFFQGKDFLTTPVKNAMKLLGYEMSDENLGVPSFPS